MLKVICIAIHIKSLFVMYKLLMWLVLILFDIENYIQSVVIAYFLSMHNIVIDNATGYCTNDMIDQYF